MLPPRRKPPDKHTTGTTAVVAAATNGAAADESRTTTILDSGTTSHVAKRVSERYHKQVTLIGIGGKKMINFAGKFRGFPGTIEDPQTPANLLATGKMLEEQQWREFKITKELNSPSDQKWIGIRRNGEEVILGRRNSSTNLLYEATDEAQHGSQRRPPALQSSSTSSSSHHNSTSLPAVHSHRSRTDRYEETKMNEIVQQLAFPRYETLKDLNNHVERLILDSDELKAHKQKTRESHTLGNMTNPRKKKMTKEQVTQKQAERGRLMFFETLCADSFTLKYKDINNCKQGYLISDRKTGTMWQIMYKNDSELLDILQQFLVNEAARWKTKLNQPNLRCIRIKMDGLTIQTSKEMKKMLAEMYNNHGVALLPVPPQYHRASGFIEARIKKVRAIATALWNGLGYKLPKSLYAYCFHHATMIADILPDSSHEGRKSSFEMREGFSPSSSFIPRTLFSTVYYKNPDTDKKMGASGTGIFVGHEDNESESVRIWDPKQNRILVRKGARFDECVSGYPSDRIQRMRAGEQVHSIHDRHVEHRRTRADTQQERQERRKTAIIANTPFMNLRYMTIENPEDTSRAIGCPICAKVFKGLGGIRRHASALLNSKKTLDGAHDTWLQESSGPGKKHAAGTTPTPTKDSQSLDTNMTTSSKKPPSKNSRRSDTDTTNNKSDRKGTRTKRGSSKTDTPAPTQRRSSGRQHKPIVRLTMASMLDEIPPTIPLREPEIESDEPPSMEKTERSYTTKSLKNPPERPTPLPSKVHRNLWKEEPPDTQDRFYNTPFTPDPSPQYKPGTYFHTLRAMLNITEDEDDCEWINDLLQKYKGPDGCHENPSHIHGYNFHTSEERHNPTTGLVILTVENAARHEPHTLEEAMLSPYWKHGLEEAVNNELKVMNDHSVFERAKLPAGRKLIGLKWVFKAKFEDGVFIKFKARLCGKGYSLIPGIEYKVGATSSPVARSHTYNICLSEAAYLGHSVYFFDIKSAYLLAALAEDVYCSLPPGIEIGLDPVTGTNCLQIKKSLYGLPQSGHNHYKRLTKQLVTLGFVQSQNDPCLFTLKRNEEVLRLCLWVDDAMVTTSSDELWEYVRENVDKDSPLSKHGELSWILGMAVTQDKKKGTISVNQSAKITAILEKFGMTEAKAKRTPLPPRWTSQAGWIPQTSQERNDTVSRARREGLPHVKDYYDFITNYRMLLGAVSHLCVWGRNDLKQATYLCARYQATPGIEHWKALRHILRYLRGTINLEMVFGTRRFADDAVLAAQVDSDYCGHAADTKSTTGYVIFMHGNAIYAESRKQRSTTLSTTEAELVAASDCVRMLRYVRRVLIEDFEYDLPPTPLGEDNQGCIHLAHDGGDWKRKRHIRVANSYLYEECTIHKTVAIKYIPSADNVADMMTKCLPGDAFERHRNMLLGQVS